MQMLKYPPVRPNGTESEIEQRVEQLVELATALVIEIETLQSELSVDRNQPGPIEVEKDGIDFYEEVERYEIALIKDALKRCGGNQTQAAKLLGLKGTTLNTKMKHYGLAPVRPTVLRRANIESPS